MSSNIIIAMSDYVLQASVLFFKKNEYFCVLQFKKDICLWYRTYLHTHDDNFMQNALYLLDYF